MFVHMKHISESESTHKSFAIFGILDYFQESTYSQLNLFAQIVNLVFVDFLVLQQSGPVSVLGYSYRKIGNYFLFYILLYYLNQVISLLIFFPTSENELHPIFLMFMQVSNNGVRQILDCSIFFQLVWKMQWVFYPNFIYFMGIQVYYWARCDFNRSNSITRLRISEQLFKETVTSIFRHLGSELIANVDDFMVAVLPQEKIKKVVINSFGKYEGEHKTNWMELSGSQYKQRGHPFDQRQFLMHKLMVPQVQINNIKILGLISLVDIRGREHPCKRSIRTKMNWMQSRQQIHGSNFTLHDLSHTHIISQLLGIVVIAEHLCFQFGQFVVENCLFDCLHICGC